MVQSKKNQVCVISGESGAGKTESTKLIVHQLMKMSRSTQFGSKLQDRIIQLNPLLEAFGNAKTLLNDNSSRFGKYLQLLFTPRGRIVGAGLEQYLLEKSRVCNPAENECNYHIFYYLFAGLSTVSPKLSEKLQLKEPSWHRYMSACQPSVNNLDKNRHRFEQVVMSMKSIGFTDVEIDEILTLLAAILHIGNIDFTADKNDNTIIKNTDVSQLVTELLSLESADDLSFALTTLRTVTRGIT
jgi:myosin-3